MTDTMKERIARAIYDRVKADFIPRHDFINDYDDEYHEALVDGVVDFSSLAEAVLAELREPTEGMLEAAVNLPGPVGPKRAWRTMIDHAISEGKT